MSRNDRSPKSRAGIIGALWVTALLAPVAGLRGDVPPEAVREQRRQQIAGMSKSERARLKKNFEKFNKLPPQQQEKLRQLDRDLKQNEDLRPVMKDYMDWLDTLSVGERGDLRAETAPDHRAALVRSLVDEQHRRIDLERGRLGPRRLALDSADLDTVLGDIEDQTLKRNLRSSQQVAELKSKKELARHVGVLELAFARKPESREQPPFWTFEPELINEIIARIANNEHRKFAEGGMTPLERQGRLFSLISFGVMAEYDKLPKPDEETLVRFLAELNQSQRDEILRLTDTARQKRRILDRYMEAHPTEYPKPPWEAINVGPFARGPWSPRGGGRGRGGMDGQGPGGRGGFGRDGQPDGGGFRGGERRGPDRGKPVP